MAKNERLAYDLAINEGETPIISITATDSVGAAVGTDAIDNVWIRIDDYYSDTALKALTDLGKSANPVAYTLSETESAIVNSQRPYEYRIVTIDFAYSTTKHITAEYILKVTNLKYHTV
jgi:hypothetical protein